MRVGSQRGVAVGDRGGPWIGNLTCRASRSPTDFFCDPEPSLSFSLDLSLEIWPHKLFFSTTGREKVEKKGANNQKEAEEEKGLLICQLICPLAA